MAVQRHWRLQPQGWCGGSGVREPRCTPAPRRTGYSPRAQSGCFFLQRTFACPRATGPTPGTGKRSPQLWHLKTVARTRPSCGKTSPNSRRSACTPSSPSGSYCRCHLPMRTSALFRRARSATWRIARHNNNGAARPGENTHTCDKKRAELTKILLPKCFPSRLIQC